MAAPPAVVPADSPSDAGSALGAAGPSVVTVLVIVGSSVNVGSAGGSGVSASRITGIGIVGIGGGTSTAELVDTGIN